MTYTITLRPPAGDPIVESDEVSPTIPEKMTPQVVIPTLLTRFVATHPESELRPWTSFTITLTP